MLEIKRTAKWGKNAIVVTTPDGRRLRLDIIWVGGNRCKIKFHDCVEVSVLRKELYDKIKEQKKELDACITLP